MISANLVGFFSVCECVCPRYILCLSLCVDKCEGAHLYIWVCMWRVKWRLDVITVLHFAFEMLSL